MRGLNKKTRQSSLCFFGHREQSSGAVKFKSWRERGEINTHTHTQAGVCCFRCVGHTWWKDHTTLVFHHIASSYNITKRGNVRLGSDNNSKSRTACGSCVRTRNQVMIRSQSYSCPLTIEQAKLRPLRPNKHTNRDTAPRLFLWLNDSIHLTWRTAWLASLFPEEKSKDSVQSIANHSSEALLGSTWNSWPPPVFLLWFFFYWLLEQLCVTASSWLETYTWPDRSDQTSWFSS